jgi:hypothetical protein
LRASAPAASFDAIVTAKQRVVLAALRDAQHDVRPAPWHGRPDLVTAALGLLERDGLVLAAAGSTRAWKITAAGRLMLPPRRGPARQRRGVGGGPSAR